MISVQAWMALRGLDDGARYNTTHTTARELIEAGLASDDWGHLSLTESGRSYLRRGKFVTRSVNCEDEYVSDMSVHAMQIPRIEIDRMPKPFWRNHAVDPMMSPQHVQAAQQQSLQAALPQQQQLLPEPPPEPLPIAETRRQEMLRAAGVASGKTGVWVEYKWVEEFIRALDT
jgi:hypothetical protein